MSGQHAQGVHGTAHYDIQHAFAVAHDEVHSGQSKLDTSAVFALVGLSTPAPLKSLGFGHLIADLRCGVSCQTTTIATAAAAAATT